MTSRDERLKRFNAADLYVVITEAHCGGRSSITILERVLEAGVRLIQFREKEQDDRALYRNAHAFRVLTSQVGALLIVDDRVDIALAVGADGVHLGQSDLAVDVARRIAPDLIVGASTHSLAEATSAQRDGADYVNIGPIFATQTKSDAPQPVGLAMIEEIAPHLHLPWTVMGGIKPDNIQEVLARGARRVAVVTAVTSASNPTQAAQELRNLIQAALR